MGGNPDDRDTRTFDRDELEKLARESVDAPDGGVEPVASRTSTVADPLTMALLAEVARNARTQEFDPDDLPEKAHQPLPHPNLKRR
ncbi:hypothetical protein BH11MYX1_BH11MYX1_04160 [soil metagenome]